MSGQRFALVTGAGQGIGAGIARRLARDGWTVVCVDVRMDNAAAIAEEITTGGNRATAMACDLGEPSTIDATWAAMQEAGATVTALVNNAGIFPRTVATEITLDEWNHVISVNLTGGFLMSQQFARQLGPHSGAIVNIASGQAYRPMPLGAHYAASKAGLANLTRALAAEWGPRGIRVNTVVPGVVDTAQPRVVMSDEDFLDLAAANPLRRLAEADDISSAVSYLLSCDASFVTGQSLAVNGGALML